MRSTTVILPNSVNHASMRGLLLMSVLCGIGAHAAGLQYLNAHSDAVVAGTVASRIEGPTQVSFTIAVNRLVAGNLPPGTSSLNVVHPWAGWVRTNRTFTDPISGMWFVHQTSPGVWDVLPARPSAGIRAVASLFFPVAAARPASGPYAYSPDAAPLDALAYEVAAGIESATADAEITRDAYEGVNTAAVQSVLAQYVTTGNPPLVAVGLAGMLDRQMPDAIAKLVNLWPSISSDTHSSDVITSLRDSWRDPTATGVAQLSLFLSLRPQTDSLRAAGVRALAAIHNTNTLPFLAGLLSSSDPDERIQAVYGLSSFANGCPMQTPLNVVSHDYLICDGPSSYRTAATVANFGFRPGPADQEQAFVSFWQTWWNSHPELH